MNMFTPFANVVHQPKYYLFVSHNTDVSSPALSPANIFGNLIILLKLYASFFRNTHLHLLRCSSAPVLLFQKWLPGNRHQKCVG